MSNTTTSSKPPSKRAANTAARAAAAAGESRPGIRVRTCSPRGSFWRAGIEFSPLPIELDLADLDDAQETAIRDEPMLVVEDIELPALEPEAKKTNET